MKKSIAIIPENREKIQAELDSAQVRCKARTITADDIFAACKRIEERLSIPNKYMEGCSFRVDVHAQQFPAAYRGRPESTQFTVVYKRHWKLIEVRRNDCHDGLKGISGTLTPEAEKAVINRMISF